jgi:hypothetical protein
MGVAGKIQSIMWLMEAYPDLITPELGLRMLNNVTELSGNSGKSVDTDKVEDFLFPNMATKDLTDAITPEEFEAMLKELEEDLEHFKNTGTTMSRRSANNNSSDPVDPSESDNNYYEWLYGLSERNKSPTDAEEALAEAINPWEDLEDTAVTPKYCMCSNPEPQNISIFRAKYICKKCELDIPEDDNE